MTVQVLEFPHLLSQIKILKEKGTWKKKYNYLSELPEIKRKLTFVPEEFFVGIKQETICPFLTFLMFVSEEQLDSWNFSAENKNKFKNLLEDLKQVDVFYAEIGGILGYHMEVLKLIQPADEYLKDRFALKHPHGFDITDPTDEQLLEGLLSLSSLGEIYPVGGAGDRLDLVDEKTFEPLPAACLPFLGFSLLDLLFRDLEAREYLFFKCFGRQLVTPVALMTSSEKQNQRHISEILKEANNFYRSENSLRIFVQPLAPMVTVEGLWAVSKNFELAKKPGGHGVIWKIAEDNEVFNWFLSQDRFKGLVRQINNPIAGLDHGLLTFAGLGLKHDKKFGFLSCPRRAGAQEGMDVLVEDKTPYGVTAGIVNIEYTDFIKRGIEDTPEEKTGYSLFPSNTNLLFVDFHQLKLAVKTNPFPGLVYNPKSEEEVLGEKKKAGRLESAMQNIADDFMDLLPEITGDNQWKNLSTYIAYNERKKTISVAKKGYDPDKSIHETPIGAFYDLLANYSDLLQSCDFEVPKLPVMDQYDPKVPPFLIYLHPAMGPFYKVIQQKLKGGKLIPGAELFLDIAECAFEQLTLLGSLQITAQRPLGHIEKRELKFSSRCGKCYFENVAVKNRGIAFDKENRFWKRDIHRHETFEIILEGNSFFYAKDVVLGGAKQIVVPDGMMVIAKERGGVVVFEEKPLEKEFFLWDYKVQSDKKVKLELNKKFIKELFHV